MKITMYSAIGLNLLGKWVRITVCKIEIKNRNRHRAALHWTSTLNKINKKIDKREMEVKSAFVLYSSQ